MRRSGLVVVVAGVAAAAGVALSWTTAQRSLIGNRWGFIGLLAAWVPVWLVGAWAVSRLGSRWTLGAVLVAGALLRLAAASGPLPSISNDAYRYAWDAHVQLAGVDPYRYPPDAPQLRRLRTAGFWPSPQQCAHLEMGAGCTVLNRPADRTIYPAVAEAWFVVVHGLTPGDAGSRPWQLAGGLVDEATIVALMIGLRDRGRDPRQAAWYALSPLPVVEFAGNGHVDGLALLLLVAALLALRRERAGLAGGLIGAATMVKLYPALAVVAAWRSPRRWRLVGAAGAVAVVAETPHLLAAGTRILGYLPGYLREEHYSSGGRFLLVGLLGLPGPVTALVAGAGLVAVIMVVLRSEWEPARGLAVLLGTLILVTTPVQPWYGVAVAGVAAVAGAPWWLVVPALGEIYYASIILAEPHQVAVGRVCYAVAALVVAAAWRHRAASSNRAGGGRIGVRDGAAPPGQPVVVVGDR